MQNHRQNNGRPASRITFAAMPSPPPNPRPLWILLAWCAINLLQAALSPLDPDETYYWMYADRLDWGYFDHPPAVALLVSMGKDWLPGALGLRFGHVLTGTALLTALYYLLDRPAGKWALVGRRPGTGPADATGLRLHRHARWAPATLYRPVLASVPTFFCASRAWLRGWYGV